MARRRGFWAEIQRESARRKRERERAAREAAARARKANQEAERRRRAAERQAAQTQRERKRLHIEGCKAQAAAMTAEVEEQIAELEEILASAVGRKPQVSFRAMKQTVNVPSFDAKGLDQPRPGPSWEDYAPRQPGALGRKLGGDARYERRLAECREQYEAHRVAYEAAEMERKQRHVARVQAYDRRVADLTTEVKVHNAEVDQFEKAFMTGDPEAIARYFMMVLDESSYPEGFPHRTRLRYLPDPRELIVEYELPALEVIPVDAGYRYIQTRDEIVPTRRKDKEIGQRYRDLIAQVALRTLHEVFSADRAGHLDVVSFFGRVSTIDKATGQPIRPLLINVSAQKDTFNGLVLTDLDPAACLRHLNALISPHPHDLEAVKPLVDFEALLAMHDFVDGVDVLASLDSRPDLLEMTPTEFEHFTRQLFEEMGMKGWTTREVKDDGVDGVVTNEDPVLGGLCIVQAKRYRHPLGPEHVRELAGAIEDKKATKGFLVTTSWVQPGGHDHAKRHGRIEIFDGEHIKHLCKQYMNLDILISLPKQRPRRGQRNRPDGAESA